MVALSASAVAGEEVRVERKQVCTCTMTDGTVGGGTWEEKADGPGRAPHVRVFPDGGPGDDVDVQVFKEGGPGEKRVIVVRHHGGDGADENKDGKVSRKEFLARAEKHFAAMDRDHSGALEKDEVRPPMPPMPPVPPVPHVAPVPPVPPAPPAPPAN